MSTLLLPLAEACCCSRCHSACAPATPTAQQCSVELLAAAGGGGSMGPNDEAHITNHLHSTRHLSHSCYTLTAQLIACVPHAPPHRLIAYVPLPISTAITLPASYHDHHHYQCSNAHLSCPTEHCWCWLSQAATGAADSS